MSYILDALRRAEAERSRGAVPGLHSPAALPEGPVAAGAQSARRVRSIGAMAALLLALGVGLGWWLRPAPPAVPGTGLAQAAAPAPTVPAASGPAFSAVAPDAAVAAAPPAPVLAPEPRAAAPVVDAARPRPQAVPERGLAVSAARPAPSAARTASPASAPVPHLNALPAELRQSLPPLKLGGAMYSDNAESRVLVLNDQLWHEGEHPAPELLLERIQPHAAQLNFRGQRFQLTY